MKLAAYPFGLLGLAVASPTILSVRDGLTAEPYDASKGMKWVGEVFPGQSYTLYGDAQSVYDQILALNPAYIATTAGVKARGMSKRNKDSGSCGGFATGRDLDIGTGVGHLNSIGGSCHVNARSCIRLTCNNTSGIYLCNDRDDAIQPSCKYLASYASDIQRACSGGLLSSLSGQEFDTDRYNVVAGYANCNHSPDEKPSDYALYGPNGKPSETCSGCI